MILHKHYFTKNKTNINKYLPNIFKYLIINMYQYFLSRNFLGLSDKLQDQMITLQLQHTYNYIGYYPFIH